MDSHKLKVSSKVDETMKEKREGNREREREREAYCALLKKHVIGNDGEK